MRTHACPSRELTRLESVHAKASTLVAIEDVQRQEVILTSLARGVVHARRAAHCARRVASEEQPDRRRCSAPLANICRAHAHFDRVLRVASQADGVIDEQLARQPRRPLPVRRGVVLEELRIPI